MNTRTKSGPARPKEERILVPQGGVSLGASQAGVYETLAAAGRMVHPMAGISIGAINAALIAGNPPRRRVQRLQEFWNRVTSPLEGAQQEAVGTSNMAFDSRAFTR